MNSPRIRPGAKEVIFLELADGSLPCNKNIDFDKFAERIADLREMIEAGKPIPAQYYRTSSGRDYLLEDYNWIHLHIGVGIDNDVLLVVEQTPEAVIFIKLTDHSIFDERPRGKSMMGLRSKIAQAKTTAKANAKAATQQAPKPSQALPPSSKGEPPTTESLDIRDMIDLVSKGPPPEGDPLS